MYSGQSPPGADGPELALKARALPGTAYVARVDLLGERSFRPVASGQGGEFAGQYGPPQANIELTGRGWPPGR